MKNTVLSAFIDDDINVKILYVSKDEDVKDKKTFYCTKNMRKFNRLVYISSGTFCITPKGSSTVEAKAGSFLLLPSGIEYKSHWEGNQCGFFCVNFHLTGEKKSFDLNNEVVLQQDETGEYLSWFKEMERIWREGKLGYKLHCTGVFYELLRMIYINVTKERVSRSCEPILMGIIHLENNYIKDITTKELAQMCNTSESNFRKYFKHYSEYPPVTYRNILRIRKGAQFLKTGEYTVSEAANAVNIGDLYYFSKLFKKVMGVSPKKYHR